MLNDYRLAFNKRGDSGDICANVVAEDDGEVWGVIYLCGHAAMAKLDVCEGVAAGHYRRDPVTVVTKAGEATPAIAFVAQPAHVCAEGRPSDDYLGKILKGAAQHDLPTEYIKSIKELAGRDGEA